MGSYMGNIKRKQGRKSPELYERVKAKRYRAQPLRRIYIPKENGKQRPISIPMVRSYCTSIQ
jgi:retron-type reverse transcriptase